MVVFQWAEPPTARADTKSGGVATAIVLDPTTNDTAASGTTINKTTVKLCDTGESALACSKTSLTVTGEGSYSVNTTTGVVTFTGEAGFIGTATRTYTVADARGAKASSTVSFTTLAAPTARADQVAGAKNETLDRKSTRLNSSHRT